MASKDKTANKFMKKPLFWILGIVVVLLIVFFIWFLIAKPKTVVKNSNQPNGSSLTPAQALLVNTAPVKNPDPNASPSPELTPSQALKVTGASVSNPVATNTASSPNLTPEEALHVTSSPVVHP